MTTQNPFKYFKTSPKIIRLAVMLYVRFPLSLRNVEYLLHERGVDISHDSTGSSYGGYEFELLRNGTSLLMEMTTEARDLIPKTQRGKPKKNGAAEELVRQLATIYEDNTGKPASKGSYHNGTTDLYEGKFILFVENSLTPFSATPAFNQQCYRGNYSPRPWLAIMAIIN